MRTDAQSDDHVRTQGDDAICVSRRKASGGASPARLASDLQPPELQEEASYLSRAIEGSRMVARQTDPRNVLVPPAPAGPVLPYT